MQPIPRQRIDKQFPLATGEHANVELLLETMFSTESVQSGYKGNIWGDKAVGSCQLSVEFCMGGCEDGT
jgi:hypothetical protein